MGVGSEMDAWMERGERCRISLRSWSSDPHHNPRIRIDQVKKRLSMLASGRQTEENKAEFAFLSRELEKLYGDLSDFWQQRSKMAWMKEGDRNTAFFHAKATKRAHTNQVDGLVDINGVMCQDRSRMEAIVSDHFVGLFHTTNPEEQEINEVLNAIEPRVSEDENLFLAQPYTGKEVTDALSSMSPLKSPGSNGFPVLFYQKYWSIIGPNAISSVLEFLNSNSLPS